MKTLALSLTLAVIAGCGVAYAEQAEQPNHGWANHGLGGPGMASVTKAQAQEMAARMFDRLDVNHDGKLDATDREARRTEMKTAMFDRMDANHDGQISRAEFMDFKPRGPGGPGGMGHDMHGPMGGPDGPGGPGMGGMGGPGRGGMGAMMMHMADTNHDGVITRDEFMAAVSKHFDEMDANHDGTVTPEERRAAHQAMRQRMHDRKDHDGMGGMGGGAMPPPPEGN
jgi:Ca2+-binding EF-hand superfamily protein